MTQFHIISLVLGLLASAVALHAIFLAPRQLRITQTEAPIPGLSREFDGYTIALLSDLHQATLPGVSHSHRAARIAQSFDPDLIALTGDFGVSFNASYAASAPFYRSGMRELAPVIADLSARDGIIAVLGNHDYYYDAPAVAEWLKSLQVKVLINEAFMVERNGARLAIAGVDDTEEGTIDPAGGCGAIPPEVHRVIFAHNPDAVLHLSATLPVSLVLAGHTHGGQVILPIVGALVRHSRICAARYPRGWVPNERVPLFVSAGVGSQIPLRFRCPPEVVIVRLRSAESDAMLP
ncbi:MAG: metallophosphoesterase family protein [Anaerolineae bacterium]|nr:metallophosphoesterase family protein [Gemmatimonadaceae bacterium]